MRAVHWTTCLHALLLGGMVFGATARAVAADVDPAVLRAQEERIAVMAKAKDAVLAIFEASGGGSGVIISADGYALTNYHVVKPCGNFMKCGMADGRLYDAVTVGIDPTGDVAVIKVLGRDDFPHATLGNSDELQAGDWVFAMGNPFLLASDFQPTVTYGIVSGVHRYQYPSGTLLEYTDCIQTDASINPGNSGGPLFDAHGRLVGINGRASFYKRGRVSVGVGYAISLNQIKNFRGALESGRIVDHATLGARVGADSEGRVTVVDILETSDAYRRGLRYGDEIISFAGRPIETPNAFKNVLGIFPKGWRVPLSFRHEGTRYDVLVRLAGLHGEAELLAKVSQRERDEEMPGPQPKPGKPNPKKVPGLPFPLPKKLPIPGHGVAKAPPMPDAVKKVFEERRGYANYFFNKLNRDRVWKNWTGRGDMTTLSGAWTITGRAGDGSPVTFELTDTASALKLPNTTWNWNSSESMEVALKPPGSGGLLMALNLWRRLALIGPQRYGEVSYAGQAPLVGHEGLVDVLVGSHAGVETRFMFDPVEGYLLALEMSVSEDADPCELYFRDYRETDNRWLPGALEVRLGNERFGVGEFQLAQWKFAKAKEKGKGE